MTVLFFLMLLIRTRAVTRDEPKTADDFRFPLWLALLATMVVTLGVYAPTLKLGFLSDDYAHIWDARQPITSMIADVLRHGQGDLHFRPLGMASIFLDYRLWNSWAPAYHLTNLFLHLSAVLGVLVLCQSLDMPTEAAAGSALIFSLLPINTEAVAWIAARFDLLATSLTIWAVVLYAKFRTTGRWSFYAAGLALSLLAFFSKESAFVLPLFLFCFELLVKGERRFKPALGFLVLGAVTFAYRWAILGGIGGYRSDSGEPSVLHLGWKSFEGILLRGPALALLGVNWLQPGGRATFAAAVLLSAILLGLALSLRTNIRGSRLMWFGLLWLALAELPVHTLLLIGPGLTNSRVLYLGSAGLAVALGTLFGSIEGRRLRLAGMLLAVLAWGFLLQHNLRAWQWSSDFSRNFLAELRRLEPSPPADAEFVLFDKPDTIRGVFFFHVGLSEAVKITYGRPDLGARLPSSQVDPTELARGRAKVIAADWVNDPEKPVRLRAMN